jgi:hypothetical protein
MKVSSAFGGGSCAASTGVAKLPHRSTNWKGNGGEEMRVVFCSGANLKQIHGDLQSRISCNQSGEEEFCTIFSIAATRHCDYAAAIVGI